MRLTAVNKSLDKKLKILGFEVPDILLIFLFIGLMNFIIQDGSDKVFYVWIPGVVLAIVLRIFKRNKPDNFLVHWVRFHILPEGLRAIPKAKLQNYSYKEQND